MDTRITRTKNSWLESIFFSNYFYGICAVALSIEATLQQGFPLNSSLYFGLVFILTVLYYSYPYTRKSKQSQNPLTNWYTRNFSVMRWHQWIFSATVLVCLVIFFIYYHQQVLTISFTQWILILIFPMAGACYYGVNSCFGKYSLRKIGWLKPLIIGFTWAGLVTFYPVLFYVITSDRHYQFEWAGVLLFIKNFMFVTMLCVMFDIKDYASDYLYSLKTFVVRFGLRKTIFSILIPLSVLGFVSFIWYAGSHHFHIVRIVLNIIPFLLLACVAYSLHKRRPLLYYMSVVDGVMLAKATCGIIAIKYF